MGRIITGSFFVAAILTFASLVRDVFPLLPEEDRERWREWMRTGRTKKPIFTDAWDLHAQMFPRRWTRALFGCLFVGAFVSMPLYLLWHGSA